MKIEKATKRYERWLAAHTAVLAPDLELKHTHMAEAVFPFLRATFYRWMQLWPEVCPDLKKAPRVLAVGDLHVENFGTWRDIEGRLVWGINDFDEVYSLPYPIDLVRLATSALMAIEAGHLAMTPEDACKSILTGYSESIEAGGRPFILAEQHTWLREMAVNPESSGRDPVAFWQKLDALPPIKKEIPASARKALERLMPEHGLAYRIVHRIAGLGSLGRRRFVALANWHGGRIAREAKALVPSACVWANDGRGSRTIFYEAALARSVRCRDPFVHLRGRWIVRRLAPDCSRIELASLPKQRQELRLLHAMGWETANVHLGTKNAVKNLRRDLRKRPRGWLFAAANAMFQRTTEDWKEWRKK